METIITKDGVNLYYKDWGRGQPIVFHHGWPLSSDDWDPQMLFFLEHGYRVIAFDRRGHGRSGQVAEGHDMDHYAADAAAVADHRDWLTRSVLSPDAIVMPQADRILNARDDCLYCGATE